MIYRSFNEGLLGKRIDESFYKLCNDIVTYIYKEEVKIWIKYEGLTSEEAKKYAADPDFSCSGIEKLKRINSSSFYYNQPTYCQATYKDENRIISSLSSKFKLKKICSEYDKNLNAQIYRFTKEQNDGSFIYIDITSYYLYYKNGRPDWHSRNYFKIKYYEDKDKAKEKLNLKESVNCGIFSNIDFI